MLKYRYNKFALLWGEAQLCLPYVCLKKKIAYFYLKVTYSYPKVTYSDPKVTYSDPKMTYGDPTHLPLPLPTSPGHCLAISWVKLNLWVGGNQL